MKQRLHAVLIATLLAMISLSTVAKPNPEAPQSPRGTADISELKFIIPLPDPIPFIRFFDRFVFSFY